MASDIITPGKLQLNDATSVLKLLQYASTSCRFICGTWMVHSSIVNALNHRFEHSAEVTYCTILLQRKVYIVLD